MRSLRPRPGFFNVELAERVRDVDAHRLLADEKTATISRLVVPDSIWSTTSASRSVRLAGHSAPSAPSGAERDDAGRGSAAFCQH